MADVWCSGTLADARGRRPQARPAMAGHAAVFCVGGADWGAGSHAARVMRSATCDMARLTARLGSRWSTAIHGAACRRIACACVVACDMAVVAEDAALGLPEVAKGLFRFSRSRSRRTRCQRRCCSISSTAARLIDAAEAKGLHVVKGRWRAARCSIPLRCRARAPSDPVDPTGADARL